MLQQDRVNLHADAKATSAKLLEREVTFIRTDMKTIAKIGTFLGGFVYKQMIGGADPRENAFEAGSLELLIVAFMFNLLCVVAAILLQVFGPYAALKAKPSELQGVARKIRVKRRMVLRMFLLGLVFFEVGHPSAIMSLRTHASYRRCCAPSITINILPHSYPHPIPTPIHSQLSTVALIWARWDHGWAGFATLVIIVSDVYIHKIYDGMNEVRTHVASSFRLHEIRIL